MGVFFFQAEDGIRDVAVTGVQTCALPILRYTSPTSRAAMRRLVGDLGGGGYYDAWEIGSRATLRELVVNEGVAIAASQAVAPGSEPWEYFGYNRRQYRRLRELDAFLRRASTNDLE